MTELSPRWWATRAVEMVVVGGSDASAFLNGQLSQDVVGLAEGQGAWALLLEPDGKLGHLLGVARSGVDQFTLLAGQGRAAAVESRLRHFVLRSKVDIERDILRVAEISGDEVDISGARLPSALGEPCVRVIEPKGLKPGDEISTAEIEVRRLQIGSLGENEGVAGVVPLALGDRVVKAAVSFEKGCYTGQELVARTTSRDAPPPTRVVHFRTPYSISPGDALTQTDDEVGHVIEAAWADDASWGFALVMRRALQSGAAPISSERGPLELLD